MKTNNFLMLSLVLMLGLNVQASQALYLPDGQLNSFKLIDWIKEHGPNEYEIYFSKDDKYTGQEHKIVSKEQISLNAKKPIDGYFFGWVLAKNAETEAFDHCQVNDFFENKVMIAFCNLRSGLVWKFGNAESFIPEIQGPVIGFSKNQIAVLTKRTETIELNEKVKILAFFKNGKALVEKPSLRHFIFGGPAAKAEYSVVDLMDLQIDFIADK